MKMAMVAALIAVAAATPGFAQKNSEKAPAPPPLVRLITPAPKTTPVAEQASAAEALALAKAYSPSDVRRAGELAILRKDFVLGMRKDPTVAEMLNTFPELGPALTEAMASQIDVYIEEFDQRFFPRATSLFQTSLSRRDIATLTEFYRSPLGRRMLETAMKSVDGQEVMAQVIAGKDFDDALLKRQLFRAGVASLGELSAAELEGVIAMMKTPAFTNFRAIIPQTHALQLEIANQPGTRFESGSMRAMGEAFRKVTGANPFGKQ